MKIKISRSKKDQKWYWRFQADNGEVIAVGEGYDRKRDCTYAVKLLQQFAATASVVIAKA